MFLFFFFEFNNEIDVFNRPLLVVSYLLDVLLHSRVLHEGMNTQCACLRMKGGDGLYLIDVVYIAIAFVFIKIIDGGSLRE